LKKLLGGLSRNFWYSVEEDKYLEASALGSDVVMIKISLSTYLALVGT
jgi:hypothetical protein